MVGNQPVIVTAARSPFDSCGRPLAGQHPASVAAHTLRGLLTKPSLSSEVVDSVIVGCASQVGSQSMNIARASALSAKWSESVSPVSLNSQRCSGLNAVVMAVGLLASGTHHYVAAGGVESMSQVPLGLPRLDQTFGPAFGPDVTLRYADTGGLQPPGILAERIAAAHQITRAEVESYAAQSRTRSTLAQKNGLFDAELARVEGGEFPYGRDELTCEQPDGEPLQPWFMPHGVLTAATVAPAADGAAFVLLASPDAVRDSELRPKARIVATSSVGASTCGRELAAVAVTQTVLQKADINLSQIDVFEIDEAFASTPLAWSKRLGVDLGRCNRYGGALTLGNPAGAGGVRMLVAALNQLDQSGQRTALVVNDGLDGAASAIVLERLEQ